MQKRWALIWGSAAGICLLVAPAASAQKTAKHPAKQHLQRKVVAAPVRLPEATRKRVFWELTIAENEGQEAAEKRYPKPANEQFDDTSPWAKQVYTESNRLIDENLKKLGHKWGLTLYHQKRKSRGDSSSASLLPCTSIVARFVIISCPSASSGVGYFQQ